MIADLEQFIRGERRYWDELKEMLDRLDTRRTGSVSIEEARRLHYLYQRAASDLAKMSTLAAGPEPRQYIEELVARAYAEIHETRGAAIKIRPLHWFFRTFPQAIRRHRGAFLLSTASFLLGSAFGGAVMVFDPESKFVVIPEEYDHLTINPGDRVAEEEARQADGAAAGGSTVFSAFLMTHNIKVSILVMSMGMTFGVGTLILLFINGILLGAVLLDYVLAGHALFVFGWLLPHGAIEIPSVLLGGQAGFVLAGALIGRGSQSTLRTRLRDAAPDLVSLVFGLAILLVWAGIIEAFLSQYHEPVLPYAFKITLGIVELTALALFLSFSGREPASREGSD